MANIKKAYLPYVDIGASDLTVRVIQASTGFYLDNADGAFRAAPGAIDVPLTEEITPSIYLFSEDRTVWADGQYHIFAYDVSGIVFSGAELFIYNDEEVSFSKLLEYMELIKKIEEGDWELVGNQWIYYDTDGTTPLITFAVTDASGNPSMTNVFKRTRT